MTLTDFRAPLSAYKTFSLKDMERHLAPLSLGGDDNIHTLVGTLEPGRHRGLSIL